MKKERKMSNKIRLPITKPYITDREKELVLEPLETGWLVQGPYVKKLEKAMCNLTGSKYGIATSSCSTAQLIASRCINLKERDEVIVPAFTWISTVNAAEIHRAKPVFVDINLNTFNIDVDEIMNKITSRTKAIFPVNLFGLPSNLPEIMKLAKEHNLKVVEDCACSLGGFIDGKHTGTFGDCGCFSFHPRKSISTGEGGMIITNDEKIAEMARSLRDHGAMKTDYDRHHSKKAFLLPEYKLLGYNYRMTDIQAAIGVAQFEKLPEIMAKKNNLAKKINSFIKNIDFLQAPFVPRGYTHGYQSYVTIFEPEKTKKAIQEKKIREIDRLSEKRNELMFNLEQNGISTRQGTHAVHIQKYYAEKYNIKPGDYIKSYSADRLTIALPFYPTMTYEEVDYLFNSLKEEYSKLN